MIVGEAVLGPNSHLLQERSSCSRTVKGHNFFFLDGRNSCADFTRRHVDLSVDPDLAFSAHKQQ